MRFKEENPGSFAAFNYRAENYSPLKSLANHRLIFAANALHYSHVTRANQMNQTIQKLCGEWKIAETSEAKMSVDVAPIIF